MIVRVSYELLHTEACRKDRGGCGGCKREDLEGEDLLFEFCHCPKEEKMPSLDTRVEIGHWGNLVKCYALKRDCLSVILRKTAWR